jgi:glycosyltransferase involved in cell wall biosynthesis
MRKQLSICYCAYNERENIAACLEDARRAVGELGISPGEVEVLVVDNASTDGTADAVRDWPAAGLEVRVISHPRNFLYSGSYNTALREARGGLVAILDGDNQYTARDLRESLVALRSGRADILFGWRRDRRDPLERKIMSAGFRLSSQVLLKHGLHDINCGYRVFTAEAAKQITLREKINAAGPEIVCLAKQRGLRVGEIAVSHFARERGRSIHQGWAGAVKSSFAFGKYLWRLRQRGQAL